MKVYRQNPPRLESPNMTTNLIIESIGRPIEKDFSKTSVAHARNAVILSDIIGADIITGDRDIAITVGKSYDNIICSYASPYMKYKKLIQVVRDNPQAKLWWLVNDHDLEDNILLRNVLKETSGNRKINMICNNARECYRGWILRKKMYDTNGDYMGVLDDFIVEWHTLNLNALIFSYVLPLDIAKKRLKCVYYGTMRKWRLDDLLQYQHAGLALSTTTKTQKKFIEKGVDQCRMTGKLSWERGKETLEKYRCSLYVEDEHTHDHYAHMANRFYEGLMCNTITLFDKKCIKTIEKSNFDIDPKYIIDGVYDLKDTVKYFQDDKHFMQAMGDNHKHMMIAKKEHNILKTQLWNLLGRGKL